MVRSTFGFISALYIQILCIFYTPCTVYKSSDKICKNAPLNRAKCVTYFILHISPCKSAKPEKWLLRVKHILRANAHSKGMYMDPTLYSVPHTVWCPVKEWRYSMGPYRHLANIFCIKQYLARKELCMCRPLLMHPMIFLCLGSSCLALIATVYFTIYQYQ